MKAALVAASLIVATTAAAESQRPPKRPVPSYDGRAKPPTTGADVARTTLRVVLFPIRLVVDYGVRWPMGKLITAAEHSRGVRSVVNYLFRGPPATTMTITPIAFYDFGFQSSIGLRFLWANGFATPGSRFSLKLGTGGVDFWRADGTIVIAVPDSRGFRAGFDVSVRRRPDQQFFGLGWDSPHSARARYLAARFGVTAYAGWRELSLVAASTATFTKESNFNNSASIEDQVAAGRITELPAGYGELVGTLRFGAALALDTRDRRDRDYSGARFDALIERVRGRDIGDWLHVDATVGGALRLDAAGEKKLDVRLRVEVISPSVSTAEADIPFLELATVGGSRDLRGFASGRGRDLSATALMVDYQWPLAAWLDATLYLGAGNVFGRGLSGFTAGRLRGSIGAGVALAGLTNERQLELWSAVGTDPFDEGGEVSSFRLVLGYSHDY